MRAHPKNHPTGESVTESQAPTSSGSAYRPVWGILFIFAGVIAVVGVSKIFAPKEIVPWRTDFDAAAVEARQAGKPLFAYFTADWCGPCQRMKRSTWADKDVETALRAYVPVKIDVDHNLKLVRNYQVNAVPTMLLLDNRGETLKKFEGAMTATEFVGWLND